MKNSLLLITFCLIFSSSFCQSWEIVGNQSYGDCWSDLQELEMINDVPHVIYIDYDSWEIRLSIFENNTWSVPTNGVIADEAGSSYRSVVDDNGVLYVAFNDQNFSDDISVKKWNGTSWEFVGAPGFGVNAVDGYGPQIICLSDNSIVIAYPAASSWNGGFGNLDVFRFNGTTWEYLGQNLAGEAVGYLSMISLSSDEIYINYQTSNNHSRVAKYDGASWNILTTPFDSDSVLVSTITVGSNDEIIAWHRTYDLFGTQFFKVTNDVWTAIPCPNSLEVDFIDVNNWSWAIEFNETDTSWYAGFTTNTNWVSFFKKFDGTSWSEVGDTIIYNPGGFLYSDLEFDSNGIPFYTSAVHNLMTWNATPVGIEENETVVDFTIYPNPCSSSISISFKASEAEFSIIDMNGKELLSKVVYNQEAIDLTAFEKGMYIVKMNGIAQRLIID